MQTSLFNDQLVADAVRCPDGWHARIVHWPASEIAEVFECPYADPTERAALDRARVLADLRFPEWRTLH